MTTGCGGDDPSTLPSWHDKVMSMGSNPRCEACNHPQSFHSGDSCQVGSCSCQQFVSAEVNNPRPGVDGEMATT